MEWTKTNDYYNREVVTCDVWSKKLEAKRTIYLQDAENFTYTFSCGANSKFSFTGSFYGTKVKTLNEAKEYLDKFIPLWFASKNKEIKLLKETIKLDIDNTFVDEEAWKALKEDEGEGSYCCGKRMVLAPSEIVYECLKCGNWEYTSR